MAMLSSSPEPQHRYFKGLLNPELPSPDHHDATTSPVSPYLNTRREPHSPGRQRADSPTYCRADRSHLEEPSSRNSYSVAGPSHHQTPARISSFSPHQDPSYGSLSRYVDYDSSPSVSPVSQRTALQTTERASVRLAAGAPTSYSHYFPTSTDKHFKSDGQPSTFRSSSKDRTRPSQKRGVFAVEDVEEPPKSKRKLSGKPREKPGPNKRGYTAKKRIEAPEMAALNEFSANTMYTLAAKHKGNDQNEAPQLVIPTKIPRNINLRLEIQDHRCMSSRYRNEDITRCVSCTRRWAGDTCRFQGVRSFFRDADGNIRGFGFQEFHKDNPAAMEFPDQWNIPLHEDHIHETKKTIAAALLPTLRGELAHIELDKVVYRPRESEVRATCDTCLTSIFCSSWMCRVCGRESCGECFEQIKSLTIEPTGASESQLRDLKSLRDKHTYVNPTFLMCLKKKDHGAKDFSPMSRFSKTELTDAIAEMERLLGGAALVDLALTDASGPQPSGSMKSDQTSTAKSGGTPDVAPSPLSSDSDATLISNGDMPHYLGAPVASGSSTEIPAHEIRQFRESDLTEEIFRPLWAQGDPLLVTDVAHKFQIDWSPEYFIKKYGAQSCLIIECQTDESKRITVAEFFTNFGQYDGRDQCWKLKDWPPSNDFESEFPELYDDFSRAVPIPSYVRRDGALNIASHFPFNTVGPDLGPKMYNANANREAFGTKGSTRLHMDMADALNIMTYAAPDPDGKAGCAAWDLFRAQDSENLRRFMRAKFTTVGPDPIHSQQVYLDDDSRRELWEQYGVKSYRVYQKAGEAVFIPAGCAHQVRNLSDCIKVAIDFVSPENVARCEKLTREFREQNQSKAWKEDVLQLRTMMWFAWLSCCRQERLAAAAS
ncbi:Clavaminate synthase-like protein [Mycena vulgaris]|nr:Clavaminate synthase-like protein [Mycena vulgaris]